VRVLSAAVPVAVVMVVMGEEAMDVGRTGAAGLPPSEDVEDGGAWMKVLDCTEELVEAGHSVAPHARSVGQQPPPRVAGQEW